MKKKSPHPKKGFVSALDRTHNTALSRRNRSMKTSQGAFVDVSSSNFYTKNDGPPI